MGDYKKQGLPTLEVAILLLKEAESLNPGLWVKHSRYVSRRSKNNCRANS